MNDLTSPSETLLISHNAGNMQRIYEVGKWLGLVEMEAFLSGNAGNVMVERLDILKQLSTVSQTNNTSFSRNNDALEPDGGTDRQTDRKTN
jgi:hypothetical protein